MPTRLIIVGRGATAERLAELARGLGYDEIAVTDRAPSSLSAADHVVIAEEDVERGRAELLRAAGGAVLPGYLGYAAPHAEGWKAVVHLCAKGIPKERVDAIAAPAGVDVGAETPEEVAIAVAAELVAVRRGRRRPSAGLEVTARGRAPLEVRPRRMIGPASGSGTGRKPGRRGGGDGGGGAGSTSEGGEGDGEGGGRN